MLGSEEHFRSTISQEAACSIYDAVRESVERARHIVLTEGCVTTLAEPVLAFDFVVGALEQLDGIAGVEKRLVKNQHLWVIGDQYALRYKQLGPGYTPSNHKSKQQERISQQQQLDGMPELVYVTAGTMYDAQTGLPTQSAIVKHAPTTMAKRQVEWVIDLKDLASGGTDVGTPILPINPAGPIAPAAVVVRRPAASDVESGQ